MCQYSAYAEDTRDAQKGETLVISTAPHGGSHWLTEPGAPDVAVCIPQFATLAVQIAGSSEVRGATFEQLEQPHNGSYDFLVFIGSPYGRVALDDLPCGTTATVLTLTVVVQEEEAPLLDFNPEIDLPDGEDDPVLIYVRRHTGRR